MDQELRRALEFGFTDAELKEAKANVKESYSQAAKSMGTRKSRDLSSGIASRIGSRKVFTSPADDLVRVAAELEKVTADECRDLLRQAWDGGKEKDPAALCRKIARENVNGLIEVWGDGMQTRSFLFIEECIEAIMRFMESDFAGPVNIGSDELISINGLAQLIADIAGKNIQIKNIDGPLGVRGRNSDNILIREKLGWAPARPLRYGLEKTYSWIAQQVASSQAA